MRLTEVIDDRSIDVRSSKKGPAKRFYNELNKDIFPVIEKLADYEDICDDPMELLEILRDAAKKAAGQG